MAAMSVGLKIRDVVGETGSKLKDQLGISEVGIRPDLRHAPPVPGSAEEAAHYRVVAKLLTPQALRSEQARDHHLVVPLVRVLAVKADLESEDGRLRCVLAADDLRLIMLARRLVLAEPDLDAVAMARTTQLAQVLWHETSNGVGNVLENRGLDHARIFALHPFLRGGAKPRPFLCGLGASPATVRVRRHPPTRARALRGG
jgi:hypothetical protein